MTTRIGWGRIRGVLVLAVLLAFCTVGWEHVYHSAISGGSVGGSIDDHLAPMLRDGLVALPLAVVAVVGGLWFGRRFTTPGRAALVAGVFGLLLAPSVVPHAHGSASAVAGPHAAHLHGPVGTAGVQGAVSVASLLHILREALIAQVAALPLMLVGLALLFSRPRSLPRLGLRRPATAVVAVAVTVLACTGVSLAGATSATAASPVHTLQLTDNPGNWFDSGTDIAGTRSLVVMQPADTVRFVVGTDTNTVHTASSLLWPTGAAGLPFDQPHAYRGQEEVQLTTPGLYVFVCKLHPFMLAAAIVDDPATPELDLGQKMTLISGLTVPTASDLAFRLLRAFFVITNPHNYQVYAPTGSTWDPVYPAVPVLAHDQSGNPVSVPDLNAAFQSYFHEPVTLAPAIPPTGHGVGQVWIDTEYEQTAHKTKPGTATAVETSNWTVSRKVALPSVNMNNPHNMWTDRSQSVIYDTQWFDNKLTVFDRKTGALIRNVTVGEAPAHVMTRVDTDQVHVSMNGEGDIVELSPLATRIDRRIQTRTPATPGSRTHTGCPPTGTRW